MQTSFALNYSTESVANPDPRHGDGGGDVGTSGTPWSTDRAVTMGPPSPRPQDSVGHSLRDVDGSIRYSTAYC